MGSQPEVTLTTSMGEITVELYVNEAPRTCKNFIELATKGYYDGVKVRRPENARESCEARPSQFSASLRRRAVSSNHPQLHDTRGRPHGDGARRGEHLRGEVRRRNHQGAPRRVVWRRHTGRGAQPMCTVSAGKFSKQR